MDKRRLKELLLFGSFIAITVGFIDILGSLLASAVFSFILSPVYVLLGIKEYYLFNHFYVFITVFIVTSLIKVILNWILDIELKHKLKKD